MTKTIRILHTDATHPSAARAAFDSGYHGYERRRASLGNGPSPYFYDRFPITLLVDWKESDAKAYAGMFFLSTIVVEVEDEEADEILTQLERRSINPAPEVVEKL